MTFMIVTKLLIGFVCAVIISVALCFLPPAVCAATYSYDALNRLKSVAYETGGGITYTYDAVGNVTGISVLSDGSLPTITSRTPAINVGGVPVSAAITITFSEPVTIASSQTAITVTGPEGIKTGQAVLAQSTITFTPSTLLVGGTLYTVSVAGVRDLSGNVMAGPVAWNFTTEDLPTATITVHFSGDGSGNVHSVPGGISCTKEPCSGQFPIGKLLTLSAAPSGGSLFDGWFNGICSGTEECALTPIGSTDVTSRFILIPPARIAGASPLYFASLNSACNALLSGTVTVQSTATTFIENVTLNQKSTILIYGGFDSDYGSVVGYTVIHGTVSIVNGTAIVERLIIR
jgi:hypothetical protein